MVCLEEERIHIQYKTILAIINSSWHNNKIFFFLLGQYNEKKKIFDV